MRASRDSRICNSTSRPYASCRATRWAWLLHIGLFSLQIAQRIGHVLGAVQLHYAVNITLRMLGIFPYVFRPMHRYYGGLYGLQRVERAGDAFVAVCHCKTLRILLNLARSILGNMLDVCAPRHTFPNSLSMSNA